MAVQQQQQQQNTLLCTTVKFKKCIFKIINMFFTAIFFSLKLGALL